MSFIINKISRNRPYQLVMSDIDGTLLSDENKILPSTENTIRELVKSGILFATASARTKSHSKRGISSIMEVCCANAYVNGTFVETSDGTVLIDDPIEDDDASHLIEQLNHVRASFCCISKDDAIAKILRPEAAKAFGQHHGSFSEKSIVDHPGFEVYLLAAEAEDLRPVLKVVTEQLNGIEASPVIRSPMTGMEVSFFQKKGTNKGAALRRITGYYGIHLSETVAFGDSMINDSPMIEAAGCGVAMKNAHNGFIEKAQHVTEKDNNEDGVGQYLRFLFGL